MRRWNRWLIVAFGAGLIWALRRPRELPEAITPQRTEPVPPQAETAPPAPERAWVEPHYDGSCPLSHPVKLKASSSIYHVEGQRNYDRTNADRCYRTTADAEADGHRPSKI